jgi:transcriptional regulator with XRE-family HTH domain
MNKSSSPSPALTSAQIRAARALIRWSAEDLARASAVGVTTIRRAELAEEATSLTAANDRSLRRALEDAGIEFIDEDGGGGRGTYEDAV